MMWSLVVVYASMLVVDAAKTLVLLDSVKKSDAVYGEYFKALEEDGHELSIHEASDKKVIFQSFGDYQFDNVIIFAPGTKDLGSIKWSELHEFIGAGGNVILATSTKITKTQRQFAAECGVEFNSKGSIVVDHFNYLDEPTNVLHSKIYANTFCPASVVVGRDFDVTKSIVFEGIGQKTNPENVLSFPVVQASSSAHSTAPMKPIKVTSDAISLVTAIQARNNARMIFSGSLKLFTTENWKNNDINNRKLAFAMSQWVFGDAGVLKTSNIRHHRQDGSRPEKMLKNIDRPDQPISLYPDAEIARESLVYRVKDNLTYSMDVMELKERKWQPYQADDMQLEFVMLDPHVRKTMSHDGKGKFFVTFESPDTYGIFQFRVMYRRLGFSTIHETTQVSLRPYKHDEYERFIPSAFPYYASAISMMTGVFVLSILFLYSSDE